MREKREGGKKRAAAATAEGEPCASKRFAYAYADALTAFRAVGQESVKRVFDMASQCPGLRGVMGDNRLMLLQLPHLLFLPNRMGQELRSNVGRQGDGRL